MRSWAHGRANPLLPIVLAAKLWPGSGNRQMGGRKQYSFAVPLLLLALSVFINYIDRGNLSIAAPLLKNELHISASQLGILLSAFFWTYTTMLFVCGWFVDRFDPSRVLALGYLVW